MAGSQRNALRNVDVRESGDAQHLSGDGVQLTLVEVETCSGRSQIGANAGGIGPQVDRAQAGADRAARLQALGVGTDGYRGAIAQDLFLVREGAAVESGQGHAAAGVAVGGEGGAIAVGVADRDAAEAGGAGRDREVAATVVAEVVRGHVGQTVDGDIAAGVERDATVGAHVVAKIGAGRAQENVPAGRDRDAARRRRDGVVIHGTRDVGGGAVGRERHVAGGIAAAYRFQAILVAQRDAAVIDDTDIPRGAHEQPAQLKDRAANSQVATMDERDAARVGLSLEIGEGTGDIVNGDACARLGGDVCDHQDADRAIGDGGA